MTYARDERTAANSYLVGLGSSMVNAQGGCNDDHTTPSYAKGGDLFMGQPPVVNPNGSPAGGTAFGSCLARNLTPCQAGKPAGWTREELMRVRRTGVDLKDDMLPLARRHCCKCRIP
jgi:hypothetical protein